MESAKKFLSGWSKFEITWLVLSTVIMVVLSIIWGDNMLALISGITGILGVVLAAKGKISTYIFATINVAIYAYLTFNNHLYGEFMLNAFYYIPMNFVGFYLWSRHKDEESGDVEGKSDAEADHNPSNRGNNSSYYILADFKSYRRTARFD